MRREKKIIVAPYPGSITVDIPSLEIEVESPYPFYKVNIVGLFSVFFQINSLIYQHFILFFLCEDNG